MIQHNRILDNRKELYNKLRDERITADVIITSPSYNLGSNGEEEVSQSEFETEIENMIKGSFHLLKPKNGKLIIDVAEWIMDRDGGKFELSRRCEEFAKAGGFNDPIKHAYTLQEIDNLSPPTHGGGKKISHSGEWDGINKHSSKQHILVFRRGEDEDLLTFSSLKEIYESDFPIRPEPCWPLDLVKDLVSAFKLNQQNITVIDPYCGSGQLGLHVLRAGGVFYGSEKMEKLRQSFEAKSKFEFSIEEDQLKLLFYKSFRKTSSDIYYIGMALIDRSTMVCRLEADYFINDSYKKKCTTLYEKLSGENLSLSQALTRRDFRGELILQTDHKIVSIDGDAQDLKSFIERYNLEEREVEALDVNIQFTQVMLEIEDRKPVVCFSPIIIGQLVNGQLLSYLVQVYPAEMISKVAERRKIIEKVRSFLGEVFARRSAGLLVQIIREQKRSARAAVFARNFSHITGSHVISNPEFRNSLAGYHFVHGLRRRLDETYSNFLRAENELMKYITQDLYRAEDLWAQGTKALADARDKLGTGDVFQENTRRFHEYLQGRFDFIARAIDDTQDPPEPVWFVRDLLEGFLRQTAYLDNLVADVGLRLDNMEFYVKIKDQEFRAQLIQPQTAGKNGTNRLTADLPFEIEWENVTSVNSNGVRTSQQQIYELDKMVAVPGGMVAAHAFYSLLENIMRNSAKYGDLRRQVQDGIYRLVIDLNTPSDSDLEAQAGLINGTSVMPSFCIKVSDNFSSDVDASGLQEKLKKPFVRPSGQPETDDLGMMEMQACSQLLCRPDGDGLYTRLNGDNPSKLEKSQFNLRVSPPDEGHAYLTYELNIEMPILLGCLTVKEIKSIPSCLYTNRPERLRSQTPFLMVIDGDWLNEKDNPQRDEIDKLLRESRDSLPNRILILYSKANIARFEQLELDKTRRIIIIIDDDPTLYSKVFGPTTHEVTSLNKDECILDVYRAWLLKRKPLPDGSPWDLWIGLDRQASQVREAWGHADKLMDDESKRLVRLMVKSSDSEFSTKSVKQCFGDESAGSKSESKYWEEESNERQLSKKKVLLFDNHGNCFLEAYRLQKATSLQESTRFYQKLSGSVSPDLFRMLSRPPQDKFSFRFFIYSLVEACLTNVVVVDERLAWSLVEGYGIDESNPNFAQDLLEHQKAGIFPVFRFRQGETPNAENAKAEKDQSIGFYNQVHKDRLGECLGIANSRLRDEGISFAAAANGSSSLGLITPSGSNPGEAGGFEILPDIKKADVILIHEGAMDILTDQMGVNWVGVDNVEHSRQLKALYQLAPIIIRTSGRGRKSKLLGEHLPFIEFGQVSSSLLTARNKFALVRGLLGSVGSKRTDG